MFRKNYDMDLFFFFFWVEHKLYSWIQENKLCMELSFNLNQFTLYNI